jgi:PDZ domain-containing protein
VVQAAPSPYSVVKPGAVLAIGPNLKLPDEHLRDTGWLALTTVRIRQASYGEWLLARLDPKSTIVPQAQVRPEGTTEREYVAIRKRWLESSKTTAAVLALSHAGYSAEIRSRGMLVARVRAAAPAAEKLRVGDVILSVAGHPVASSAEIGALLAKREIGSEVPVKILRDDRRISLTVATSESSNESGRAALGVRISPYIVDAQLPFSLEAKTDRIMGSSAGLMLALAIYDAVTDGDLAGGHRVAGTGTIDPNGRVGSIGSIAEKVAGAEGEQADVFLAPRENAETARRAARSLRVVAVSSFDEAVAALQQLGGRAERPLASVPAASSE